MRFPVRQHFDRHFRGHLRIFLTGLLTILPLGVTIMVIGWVGTLLAQLAGPGSLLGSMLVVIGITVSPTPIVAYFIGSIVVAGLIYALGIAVQRGFQTSIQSLIETRIRALPVIGSIYDLSSRFVGMLDKKESTDLKTMSPVWCHFGGKGNTTVVLALLPTPERVMLGGQPHHVILVPTAPVPFGGGLLYVPVDWIEPAPFGVDGLTSIYVSMGVTSPGIQVPKIPPRESGLPPAV